MTDSEMKQLLGQVPVLCQQVGSLASAVSGLETEVRAVKDDLGREIGDFRKENREDHGEIKANQKLTNSNVTTLQKFQARFEGGLSAVKAQWAVIAFVAGIGITILLK